MATAIQAPADAAGPTSHTQNQDGQSGYTREEQKEALSRLREPFPAEEILQRPEILCADCENQPSKVCRAHHLVRCSGCGQTVTVAHVDLAYVGHAEATERLLEVDPFWDWQPVAVDAHGLPLVDELGGLWIRLTVVGVTRLGYGSSGGKGRSANAVKELIGNAIRNAGMRFGMALDLWKKSDQRRAQGADRIAVGLPQASDIRLQQLTQWARTHWGHLDKLMAIRDWVIGEDFSASLVSGPGGDLVAMGPLLDGQITLLEQQPPSTPTGQAPAATDHMPAPADPENTPDPPHEDDPSEDEVLDRMVARVFLHWDKPILLEQDLTEVRRLDLLERNVESLPDWGCEWMRFEDLLTRRLAEHKATDTERSAA